MARARVGVVGAGFVGATTAQRIVDRNLADVILTDILDGIPQGKGLDIAQAAPVEGFDRKIRGTNAVEELSDCDVVVITAGFPRKPGMSREELIDKNAGIVRSVCELIAKRSPNAILLVVTNPLDIMTYLALRLTKFPPERVLGMAGVLDASRFAYFIAEDLGVSVKDIRAMVLGGHGDAMVPLPRYTTVSGISILDLLPKSAIDRLVQRTRDGGAEIVSLLKQGSAYYAPSSAIVAMVESILQDEKRILPGCAYLNGQYGLKDICVGVPIKLGRRGVEQVLELKLTPQELDELGRSAKIVEDGIRHLKLRS